MSFAKRSEDIVVGRTDKLITILDSFCEVFSDSLVISIVVDSDLSLPLKGMVISNIVVHQPQNDISKVPCLH